MTLKEAVKKANDLTVNADDNYHVYVFPIPNQPRQYMIVPEDDPKLSTYKNARYCQNGRGARMDSGKIIQLR